MKIMWDTFHSWIRLCRLHRPLPLLFFFFPCIWGNLLVHKGVLNWTEACFFLAGCIWARSIGCAINDYLDRTIDSHVTRTQHRPLACGALSPSHVRKGLLFFLATGIFFLCVLPSSLHLLAIISACATLAYPLCKRFFPLPQLFLGFTINCGVLMSYGWACPLWWAHTDVWVLYIIAVLWTMEYDTLYGYQDILEDRLLALHSLPLMLGEPPTPMRYFFRLCLLLRTSLIIALYKKVSLLPILFLWVLRRWHTFSHLPFSHPLSYEKAFRTSLWEGVLLSVLLTYR